MRPVGYLIAKTHILPFAHCYSHGEVALPAAEKTGKVGLLVTPQIQNSFKVDMSCVDADVHVVLRGVVPLPGIVSGEITLGGGVGSLVVSNNYKYISTISLINFNIQSYVNRGKILKITRWCTRFQYPAH